MEAIVTRVSDNCKLIISGCDSQRDIRGESGLRWFKDFCVRHNLEDEVGVVNFDSPEDIVRGGLVKKIAYGLAKDNGSTKFKE
jgi:phosphate starvation-inducible PhoH-like protein